MGHFGYTKVKFADPIKKMLKAAGLTHVQLEGSDKEMPCEMLGGKTPRWAMQTLGTEWGRNLIGENLWVELWRCEVERLLKKQALVVVDDLRFNNEWSAVKSLGGLVVRVDRPGLTADVHSSERSILRSDFELLNSGDKSFYLEQVKDLMREIIFDMEMKANEIT